MYLYIGAYNILAINVFFNELTYSVDESSEQLELMLALSDQSSIDVTVQFMVNSGGTATGQLTNGNNFSDGCSSYSRG